MSEARFLKIIVVAMLLLNLGTLGYLWMDRGGRERRRPPFSHEGPPGRGGPHGDAAAFLNEALHFTNAQEASYRFLREGHHETVLTIREEMKQAKQSLYAQMKRMDTGTTRGETQRWLDSLAAKQRRIEAVTYAHFREVRALCTPPQQQKFDAVIGEALEQMR